jgi:hypothetical protein
VPVTLNTVARVDAVLQVGELAETVTVIGESPLLQADRAEVRAELREHDLRDLPVPIGRNYQRLFKVIPRFTPPEDAHSIPSNPSRALVFNVNGSSRSSNNTRIDGVSTTNVWLPHVAAYVPALESLETVNVVTNSFDAEQGLAGGSVINVQIKSGTNSLTGSAFEYHTNEAMRAHNYFDPPGTEKGKWRYHQFGGTVGGPIVRNKLFYFGSYENTHDTRNVSRTISVPTEALRRGDLSASPTRIYDPTTGNPDGSGRTAFPGNVIPPDRIDPIARKVIALMPLPNLRDPDGSIPETRNYFVQAPFTFNRWTLDTKVNWNATPKLTLFGRYSHLDFWTFNETVYGKQLQGLRLAAATPAQAPAIRITSLRAPPIPCPTPWWPMRTSVTSACTPASSTATSRSRKVWSFSESRARMGRAASKAGCRSLTSTRTKTSASPSGTCRITATTISIRRL